MRGYKASEKVPQQKTSNEKRKTGKRVPNTPANGGIDGREIYHFRRLAITLAMHNKIKGLLQTQATLFAGFSTRQVPRWSLTCTR